MADLARERGSVFFVVGTELQDRRSQAFVIFGRHDGLVLVRRVLKATSAGRLANFDALAPGMTALADVPDRLKEVRRESHLPLQHLVWRSV